MIRLERYPDGKVSANYLASAGEADARNQEEKMKRYLYGLLLGASSAIGFAPQGPALGARGPDGGGIVELGSLKSRAPADWMEVPPDHPRDFKQYRLEPIHDDKYAGRVTVRFLGPGKGGTGAEYVEAWKAMFLPPLGQTMREAAKVRKLPVPGAAVTYLDVRGDYKGVPGDPTTPRQNFRLLGVHLDTPKGPYLILLFGPADTVGYYRQEFEDWVKAFK